MSLIASLAPSGLVGSAAAQSPAQAEHVCVPTVNVCLPDVPPEDDPPPPPSCDSGGPTNRVLAMYAYPNGNNRVGSVGPLIVNDTVWIDGQFDFAAGPTRDQEVQWRWDTNGTLLICTFSVSDPDNDGHVSYWDVRNAAVNAGYDRSDRRYLIWFDGTIDCGACSLDSHGVSPAPAGGETAGLHELVHLLGGPHTIEQNDFMQDYTGDRSTDLCGPERTIDCNKNEFYSTYCAVNFCSLTGYNVATSPFLTAPHATSYTATCGNVAATFGDEDADSFPGSSAADIFQGWEGNDTLRGAGGNDLLCGHWGIDRIEGQAGADKVYGGWGDDEVFGGDGDDQVWGGEGEGDDALFDGAGADTIDGGAGIYDVLNGCLDNTTDTIVNVEYHFISTNYCTPVGSGTHMLAPGQRLLPGQSLISTNGLYTLEMQTDGNLVLYKPGRVAVWSTNTYNAGAYVIMQVDGHLVMYTPAGGNIPWQSWTWGNNGSSLTLQTDCNLVIYRQDGSASWATGTNGC